MKSILKIIIHVLKLLQKILYVLFENLMHMGHFEICLLKLIKKLSRNLVYMGGSPGDVGEALLILQPFRHFTHVTAHSPIRHFTYVTAHSLTLPLLHLCHSSFSNPLLHLCHSSFSNPSFSSASFSLYFKGLACKGRKIVRLQKKIMS